MIQRLARFRSPLALALLVAAAVVLIQALLVPLFAGPAVNQAPGTCRWSLPGRRRPSPG